MTPQLRPHLILLFSLLLMQPAQSQEAAPAFKVELILFKNNYLKPSEIEAIDYRKNQSLSSSSIALPWPGSLVQTRTTQPTIADYRRITQQQSLRLLNQNEALKRAPRYQSLCYLAWVQPSRSAKNSRAVNVTQSEPSCQTTGEIKIYRKRFIHAKLNLLIGDTNNPNKRALLQENRRIEANKMNYFDHPQVGALLLVSEINDQQNSPDF